MLDERRYPVIVGLDAEGAPEVRWMLRRDFTPAVLRSKWGNSVFKWGLDNGWRCFVSGVQCVWMPDSWHDSPRLRRLVPWSLSWDHLVPVHLARGRDGDGPGNPAYRLGNQAVVGRHLNNRCGHIPLALKLLHRRTLLGEAYDRDTSTHETLATVRRRITATEDTFLDGGRYPWQPWAHPEGSASRARAESFMREMESFDAGFLAVPRFERDAFVEAFEWRW